MIAIDSENVAKPVHYYLDIHTPLCLKKLFTNVVASRLGDLASEINNVQYFEILQGLLYTHKYVM